MEHYRKKLNLQNTVAAIGCLILAGFGLLAIGSELGWFSVLHPIAGDAHWQSAWYGYITGISCGIFALLLAGLIRNIHAMKDEKKLKKRYVKEHDERSIRIAALARNTAMQILLPAGLVASVIAGYFSIPVSITILACTFCSSAVSMILLVYYSKKF